MIGISDSSDNNTGIYRQRRNLIIMSISLICLETSKMKLEKINIFGNEISIGNPYLLPLGLWLGYIYFLIRYFQYFNTIDRGVKFAYNIGFNKYLINWAYMKGKKDYIESYNINDPTKYMFGEPQSYFNDFMTWSVTIDGKANVTMKPSTNNDISDIPSELLFRQKVTWPTMLLFRIKSALNVCICTHLVSEYYLPFIIALLPIIWKLTHLTG